jgi:hypothetical protein
MVLSSTDHRAWSRMVARRMQERRPDYASDLGLIPHRLKRSLPRERKRQCVTPGPEPSANCAGPERDC